MLNDQFTAIQEDLTADFPRSLFVNKLVNLRAFIQEKLGLDVALSSKSLLLAFLVKHVLYLLMSDVHGLGITTWSFKLR